MRNMQTIIAQNKILEEAIRGYEKINEHLDLCSAAFNSLKPKKQKLMKKEYARELQKIYTKTKQINNVVSMALRSSFLCSDKEV